MGVKGIGGIGAPTTARKWDLTSHGFLANFGVRRFPKGNEGKRVSSGYNRRRRLATRSSGKQQAERTAVRTAPIVCPEESPLVRPQAQSPCPGWGMTRRLRRGSRACSPMGRSHFSFGGERKVCKRKPAARRLREKALYCPFLKEGVRNVARRPVSELTHTFVRARAHSFPLSKRARLFPSAAYRRPRPRAWHRAYAGIAAWDASMQLGYFCNAKYQRGFKSTLAFAASHETFRRVAVYTRQPTGNRTRPASRGTCRATAVTPQPSRMSH